MIFLLPYNTYLLLLIYVSFYEEKYYLNMVRKYLNYSHKCSDISKCSRFLKHFKPF